MKGSQSLLPKKTMAKFLSELKRTHKHQSQNKMPDQGTVAQRSQAINQQTLQARQKSMLLSLASERMCLQEYFLLRIKQGPKRVKESQ